MLELRLRCGVDPRAFQSRWDLDIEARFPEILAQFRAGGLMEKLPDGRWRITRDGLKVSNAILREFI